MEVEGPFSQINCQSSPPQLKIQGTSRLKKYCLAWDKRSWVLKRQRFWQKI